jgi:hypothetical protein
MGNLNAMPLFAESDFEQFTNGTLVIHYQDVHRVLARSLSGGLCGLH